MAGSLPRAAGAPVRVTALGRDDEKTRIDDGVTREQPYHGLLADARQDRQEHAASPCARPHITGGFEKQLAEVLELAARTPALDDVIALAPAALDDPLLAVRLDLVVDRDRRQRPEADPGKRLLDN